MVLVKNKGELMRYDFKLVHATTTVAILLLLISFVHGQYAGEPIYTQDWAVSSVIIPFDFLLMLSVGHLVLTVMYIFKRNAKASIANLLLGIFALLVCLIATLLDTATLIYAT